MTYTQFFNACAWQLTVLVVVIQATLFANTMAVYLISWYVVIVTVIIGFLVRFISYPDEKLLNVAEWHNLDIRSDIGPSAILNGYISQCTSIIEIILFIGHNNLFYALTWSIAVLVQHLWMKRLKHLKNHQVSADISTR